MFLIASQSVFAPSPYCSVLSRESKHQNKFLPKRNESIFDDCYNALVLSIPLNEIFFYIRHCSIIFCNNSQAHLKGGLWCLALISTILQLYRGGQPHYCSSLHKMTVEITLSRAAWVRTRLCKLQKRCTRLAAASDKVYQLLAHDRWFSLSTPASSTTKTSRHDIAEILLKVALKTINQIKSLSR